MKPGDRYKSRVTGVAVTIKSIAEDEITAVTDSGSTLRMTPAAVFFSYFEEVPSEGRDQG